VAREVPTLFGEFPRRPTTSPPTPAGRSPKDVRKFAGWFVVANKEPLTLGRVTTRDVTDFSGTTYVVTGQASRRQRQPMSRHASVASSGGWPGRGI